MSTRAPLLDLATKVAKHPAVATSAVPELVPPQQLVADETTKYVIRDQRGTASQFVVCSPKSEPQLVYDKIRVAKAARKMLGPELGAHVLAPSAEGTVDSLSFAVFPYCRQLTTRKLPWLVERQSLGRKALDWLRAVTEQTCKPAGPDELAQLPPALEQLAALPDLPRHLSYAAREAARAVREGRWHPRTVLMHGDLWKGNFMKPPVDSGGPDFVVTDWWIAGLSGYPIYDFLRIAQSFRLPRRQHLAESQAYAQILECNEVRIVSYMLCALATICANAGAFPGTTIAKMTELCYEQLVTGQIWSP